MQYGLSKREQLHLEKAFDVVCVGAGLAGLYAAVVLATQGIKVLLVEHHTKPGGCCSSFRRRSFTFDAGPHLFSGLGDSGSTALLLERVGVNVAARRLNPMETVYFADCPYKMPDGAAALKEWLGKCFPREVARLEALFRDIHQTYFRTIRLGRAAPELYAITFRAYFEKFVDDPLLVALLASQWPYLGVVPARAVAFPMLSMVASFWYEGIFYPVGGSQAVADALYHRFMEAGGVSLFYHDVTHIDRTKGRLVIAIEPRARGVGFEVSASHVLFNGSEHGFADVADYAADVRRDLAAEYVPGGAPLMVYLGLGRPMPEIQGIYYDNPRIDEVDSGCFVVGNPTNHDPSRDPRNNSVLTVYQPFPQVPKELDDWASRKAWAVERAMKRLYERFPDLEGNVELLEAAGPQTIERFTLNTGGSAYGHSYELRAVGQAKYYTPQDYFGDNVTLTGHWTYPGGGVNAAIVSGWIASKRVLAATQAARTSPRQLCSS